MGDVNQDDIDKLLAGAFGDADGAKAPASGEVVDSGPASQDDIDALFAAAGGSAPAPPEPAPTAASAPAADASGAENGGALAGQDDIDALFAAIGESAPSPEPAAAPAGVEDGPAGQDDIDALFAAIGEEAPKTAAEQPPPSSSDASDAGEDGASITEFLDALAPPPAAETDDLKVDTVDMDELLSEISNLAPTAAPRSRTLDDAPTVILPSSILSGSPDAEVPGLPGMAAPPQPPPARPPLPLPSLPPPAAQLRDTLSVMASAGEVESMAGQISGMLGQLSEKAHRYMQAWLSADSEAKELRSRLLNEEHLCAVANGEKDAFAKELEFLRGKIGTLEGERIGAEEARRTSESGLHTQIRELESRSKVQAAEIESLKDELTRSRTEATGVDIESRRARFEADRLRSEAESERMERLRIQRALENREKELQAMQAQAAGQASSLFIDELHRLVRRLESELDARTSGAHEALRQLDRLDVPEDMVPVASNLRASLMQAIGADDSGDDALKSLGREAGRVRGPQGIAPGKTEMLSFESALTTYNLTAALEVAGALLREVKATPSALMRRIYQAPALRRSEIGEHLSDLARLLEGLRTVQESADRARGSESAETEVFYVQMFDYLHNLVRLKFVNRLAGEVWRIFLDLRGRFSFVTSDKQWADYRDGVLGGKQSV